MSLRAGAADLADHGHRAPCRDGRLFALERLVADGLERDRARGRLHRGLADEDRSGLGDGLQAGRGIHEVAGDHPLAFGTQVDGRFPGQDARA